MENTILPGRLGKFEIPGRVTFAHGSGGLPKINITTGRSTAEIYLHGAHVTGFQKGGEPPLLFMSRLSQFVAGKAIRGGVPICLPWFGLREGEPTHGFVRILSWELVETSASQDGTVTIRQRLPKDAARPEWSALHTEFIVTISDQLTMELIAANESADKRLEIENCLHTYFQVGDINRVSITGLQGAPFNDFAAGAAGMRKVENDAVLRITKETNRVYPDAAGPVEIHDENLERIIRVEKFNSQSTVVWNPWTTQKLPDDFDPAEYRQMVCVESGNLKQNKISLPPGKSAGLKVVLSSRSL
jgi:D-hexose-6-phosphate mutarotase